MNLHDAVHTVEFKVTVPSAEAFAAQRELNLDPIESTLRQVYFYDTPELSLSEAGVVLRSRRTAGGEFDCAVKLRPVDPGIFPERLRRRDDFVIEVDVIGRRALCTAAFTAAPRFDPELVITEEAEVHDLFRSRQRAFVAEYASVEPPYDELTVIGPVLVMKLKQMGEGHEWPVVAELWRYPDDSSLLELSMRAAAAEAPKASKRWRAFLREMGLSTKQAGETKTRRAMKVFAQQAQALP